MTGRAKNKKKWEKKEDTAFEKHDRDRTRHVENRSPETHSESLLKTYQGRAKQNTNSMEKKLEPVKKKKNNREKRKKKEKRIFVGSALEVASVSSQKCRFACYIRHAVPCTVERGRKEKNMDVSHPGFKCTPSAPGAT